MQQYFEPFSVALCHQPYNTLLKMVTLFTRATPGTPASDINKTTVTFYIIVLFGT